MPLLPALLLACTRDPTPAPTVEPSVTLRTNLAYAGDPYDRAEVVFVGDPDDVDLVATGPDGRPARFETHFEPVEDGTRAIWVPVEPLVPGEHIVTGVLGLDVAVAPLTFEVQPWGRDPDFSGLQVGDAFLFDAHAITVEEPPAVGALLLDQLPGLQIAVEVLAVGAGEADLRFVVVEGDTACLVHEESADIDDGGHLELELEAVPFELGGETGAVFDIALDLRLYDGDVRAGRLEAVPELGPLGSALFQQGNPQALCDLTELFGVECGTCPNGESETCLPIVLEDLAGTAWTPFWQPGAPILPCTSDPDPLFQGPPAFSCESGCETTSVGNGLPIFGWMLLLLRRRA